MNLRVRKIRVTGGSLSVGLPPDWLTGNGLHPGDELELWYDGEVHIRPRKREASSDV